MPGLLDPISIKNLTLKNRIVMPPMANNLATEKGEITPRLIDHYVRRAGAEIALLIVEHSYVVTTGRFHRNQLGIHEDGLVAGLKELVDRVHAGGARIGVQITHAGSAALCWRIGGCGWLAMANMSCVIDSPWNGSEPLNTSYMITPMA